MDIYNPIPTKVPIKILRRSDSTNILTTNTTPPITKDRIKNA